jgi:hypothetical protein
VRFVDQATHARQRAPPDTSHTCCLQLGDPKQSKAICFLERLLVLFLVNDFAEIEDRSCNGCDRNARDFGSVIWIEPTLVDANTRSPSSGHRCHFNRRTSIVHQSPQRRGAPVTQQSALSASQHTRDP